MPMKFAPAGTQVGTPAWVPDEVEENDGMTEDTGVAKHWFVHLRKIVSRPSDRTNVKIDTAGTNTRLSSRASSGISSFGSGGSIVSVGQAGKSHRLYCAASAPSLILASSVAKCVPCASSWSIVHILHPHLLMFLHSHSRQMYVCHIPGPVLSCMIEASP